MMRAGYVMHRYVHRAFGPEVPPAAHSTDGAEMGKALVAEGVGVTILPDYSVIGCPLHRVGMIESRPIAGNQTFVTLQPAPAQDAAAAAPRARVRRTRWPRAPRSTAPRPRGPAPARRPERRR
nr:hypothetical protein [Nocardioides convexus]